MKILITDTLFVFKQHEDRLKAAGFEIIRNPNPKLTEDELIEALKDIDGYIVGGVEHPSDKAIASANKLKCVAVTAADWQGFMPGYKAAIEKGISIGNTPGSNTYAVAEFTLSVMLSLVRSLPELMNPGRETFKTSKSLQTLSVGIIGAGRIGETLISMLHGIGVKNIYYWNRTRKPEIESRWGVEYLSLTDLCKKSDVISNHTASSAGLIIDANLISSMKNGTILINNGGHGAVDEKALKERLVKEELSYGSDENSELLKNIPNHINYHSNSPTAFNTQASLDCMSDQVTDFIIDVLKNNDKSKAVA